MGWIEREAEKHKHNNPKTGPVDAEVGDKWECSCGKVFRVTSVRKQYDQRDGDFSYLTWTEEFGRRSATEPTYRNSLASQRDEGVYYGPYGYGSQDR